MRPGHLHQDPYHPTESAQATTFLTKSRLRSHIRPRQAITLCYGPPRVYTVSYGTLLGQAARCSATPWGWRFPMACAGYRGLPPGRVEIVVMSGAASPRSTLARLRGQAPTSMKPLRLRDRRRTTVLTLDLQPERGGTVYRAIEARGTPRALCDRFPEHWIPDPCHHAASSPTSSAARLT